MTRHRFSVVEAATLYAPDGWSILPLYCSGARLLGTQQTVLTC